MCKISEPWARSGAIRVDLEQECCSITCLFIPLDAQIITQVISCDSIIKEFTEIQLILSKFEVTNYITIIHMRQISVRVHEYIPTETARHVVITRSAGKNVITIAANQNVVTIAANQNFVTMAPRDVRLQVEYSRI